MIDLIRIKINRDGTFSAADATDWDGMPTPINSEEVSALFPTLNTAALAEIESLKSRLSEAPAQSQPGTQSQSPLIEQLHAAFVGTLTEPQQVAYAAPYAIVRTLVASDNLKLAADYMLTVPTPPELEPARAGLIALINSFISQ